MGNDEAKPLEGAKQEQPIKKETVEDIRGVRRGRCMTEDCDCDSYFYNDSNVAICRYCSCPPTKHERLDYRNKNNTATKPNFPGLTNNYRQIAIGKTAKDVLKDFELLAAVGKMVLNANNENTDDVVRLRALLDSVENSNKLNVLS